MSSFRRYVELTHQAGIDEAGRVAAAILVLAEAVDQLRLFLEWKLGSQSEQK